LLINNLKDFVLQSALFARVRQDLVIAGILIVVPLFALRSILFGSGTPAYLHDWSWPLTASQLSDSLHFNLSAWDLGSVGKANPFPLYHPIYFVWHWLASLVGALTSLKLTLLFVFIALATGAYASARWWFGTTRFSAVVMAVAVVLGPATYTKLLAGHMYYLIALAAFAWMIALGALAAKRRWYFGLAAGALAALTAIQIQLFLAAFVVLIVLLVLRIRSVGLPLAVAAILTSLVLLTPELFALQSGSTEQLSILRANLHWELNNSPPLASVPVAMGYFTGYADKAYGSFSLGAMLRAILWIVPLAAIIAALFRRSARTLVFAALWLVFLTISAGLNGPLQHLLTIAFSRWEATTILREFYHFAAPAWMIACILAASGLDTLPNSSRLLAASATAIATAVIWLPGNFAGQLQTWQTDVGFSANVSYLAGIEGSWRVLFIPELWPVGPIQWHTGGVDPAAYGIADHPAANTYAPTAVQQIAFYYSRTGDSRAQRWLEALGIGGEIYQANIVSRLRQVSEAPHKWPPFFQRQRESERISRSSRVIIWGTPVAFAADDLQVVRTPLDWTKGPGFVLARDALPSIEDDPDRVEDAGRFVPAAPLDEVDPSRGWVNARLWSWLDPRIAALDGGVVSWSVRPLTIPRFGAVGSQIAMRTVCLSGELWADDKRLPIARGILSWVPLPKGTRQVWVRNGVAAVGEFVAARHFNESSLPRYRSSRLRPLAFDPRFLRVSGRVPAGTAWIVLKESFSNAWQLTLEHGVVESHVRANGFANAWKVRTPNATALQISYVPAPRVTDFQISSLIVWSAVCVVSLSGALGLRLKSR